MCCLFFFKKKTAYEMRISDWSSDVCSSDLVDRDALARTDDDDIADHDILGQNVERSPVALDARGLGLQTGEFLDRRARPAAGAGLKQPAEEDQRRSEGRRVGKEVGRTGRSCVMRVP